MAIRKKAPESYLVDKRNEILWSLGQQSYSLSQIAWIFNMSKTAVHNIIKETPKDWKSPFIKVTSPEYQKFVKGKCK